MRRKAQLTFTSILRHQPKHQHLLLLSISMATRDCLKILMRIEVRVKNDDCRVSSTLCASPEPTDIRQLNVPVSAEAKLIPTPPARVVNRYMKYSESGALNLSISFCRAACWISPSRRRYLIPSPARKSSTASSANHMKRASSSLRSIAYGEVGRAPSREEGGTYCDQEPF